MNFVQFASTYNVVNNELTKLPDNVIPRIFPTYSSNPKGQNFGPYCKYQLLRYKPWRTTQNNAWGDQAPTDEVLINCWHEFLQTSYGQLNVPDWFDKLQAVIQSQESEPEEQQQVTREEWMYYQIFTLRLVTLTKHQIQSMIGILIEPATQSNKLMKCQHG